MEYTMQGEEMPAASTTPDAFNWDKFTQNTTSLLGASALVINAVKDTPPTVNQNAPQATAVKKDDDTGVSTSTWVIGGVVVIAIIGVVILVARK